MKNLPVICLLFLVVCAKAQQKTFLDQQLQPTEKDQALFYRISTDDPDIKLTKIEIYFSDNDQISAEGYVNMNDHTIKNGTWQWYYHNGALRRISTYSDGNQVGNIVTYHPNTKLKERFTMNPSRRSSMPYDYKYRSSDGENTEIKNGNGTYNGPYSGPLNQAIDSISGTYQNGKATGTWLSFKENKVVNRAVYKEGNLISGNYYDGSTSHSYTEFYQPPQPAMDWNKYMRRLQLNFNYYLEGMDLQDTDFIKNFRWSFRVDETGKVYDLSIINGTGKIIDRAALRAFQLMEVDWKPARLEGHPIDSSYSIGLELESRLGPDGRE